jgi:hypothetical protein
LRRDQVLLGLGEPPSPVPASFADLLLRWTTKRDNMNSAANHASTWLFPGRRAGQPMHSDSLAALANKAGVTTAGRAATTRQHVLEMPAPLVADAPTYHYVRVICEPSRVRSRLAFRLPVRRGCGLAEASGLPLV